MVRLGINGFGRIGRQVLKAVIERYPETLQVAAINDLFDVHTNAHLFKYDSNYGRFEGQLEVKENGFLIRSLNTFITVLKTANNLRPFNNSSVASYGMSSPCTKNYVKVFSYSCQIFNLYLPGNVCT